ncbi:EKC/KEOPS complex subunit BUD32 [Fusarium sp. LHS14.1]|nr:EKC/KEOPS complex subunit BUD32 [Fusarium sp. LHS14.1]
MSTVTSDPRSPRTSTPESILSDADRSETKDCRHCITISWADHPPATAEGVFLGGPEDDVESLEGYHEGGFHPVKIGDCFGALGQYRVLHKLGYGGYATVWLCRDTHHSRYVALKILMATVHPDTIPELEILSQLDCTLPGAEFIAIPLEHFTFQGPNGTHQALVLPVLGPRVSPEIWRHMKTNPNVTLRQLARQATKALNFLHKNQICHGDFRPGNILINLANIDHLPETELMTLIGPPITFRVRHVSGGEIPSSCPPCLIERCNLGSLSDYFVDKITLIDFGESFHFSSPPKALSIPDSYQPAELLLGEPPIPGPSTDLWALGCSLFEIRQQIKLFYMLPNTDEIIAEIAMLFGKLPNSLWDKWDSRKKFFDDNGHRLRFESATLEMFLTQELELWEPQPGASWSSLFTPETEQKQLSDLI